MIYITHMKIIKNINVKVDENENTKNVDQLENINVEIKENIKTILKHIKMIILILNGIKNKNIIKVENLISIKGIKGSIKSIKIFIKRIIEEVII